ncbi:glycosyltransferase [Alteriqipengyuania lutimaris]|uniref:Glycosyltransferase n=1 Tax=Alteriqipengyuania lutimaris TaxID=1538146 RepID=A0A395LJ84_9SPHN|nr:glycosyltransferase [Alteriqipengyuania lutimaris]MBB3034352.1 glycosyltransferase involved in cell wall biosynthesis [Alteriqipengyuania lutimaris]RDS76745.1 glycosyltransferase [Alteriqipengyuania lutimaris]
MDRCEAVGAALEGRAHVVGVELAEASSTYAWSASGVGKNFEKRTLFPGATMETLSTVAIARALMSEVTRPATSAVFFAGYERPSHFAAAISARMRGVRTIVMLDSKYDDKPRKAWLETAKRGLMLPYSGGFASGRRSREYLHHLGLGHRLVTEGYDSVSIARVRHLAASIEPQPWDARPFLAVARFVPKKNLSLLLDAYALYCARVDRPRELQLCGGGPLEGELRQQAERLGIGEHVRFFGFVGPEKVAGLMRGALCLALPSVEEQWGLVINEALAFGLPLIVSPGIGATDTLALHGENALTVPPGDTSGWADALVRLGSDRELHDRLSARSAQLAPSGDVAAFVDGVRPHIADLVRNPL